ncbi:uncharacterized protein [Panulirus ornatus]|uniref:uncharacterized protein n=1 Tax=Panulirus ornatus TaxID=150431 RepID=UPI003A84F2A7
MLNLIKMLNFIKFILAASILMKDFHLSTAQTYNIGGSTGHVPTNPGSTTDQTAPIILDSTQGQTFLGASNSFRTQGTSGIGSNLKITNQLGTFPSGDSVPLNDFRRFGQGAASGNNLRGSGISFNQPSVAGINPGDSRITFGQAAVGSVNLGGSIIGSGQPSIGSFGVGNAIVGSGQSGIGSFGVGDSGLSFGQAGAVAGSGFNAGGPFGIGQGPTRIIEAPATPTVTNTVTIDRFVTVTDLAFHSVPVTLTDLVLRTTTVTSRQPIITPVDDRIALQTSVIIRPTSLTVTCTKHDYIIKTEVAVDYVTITHTSYIIRQTTYTTTVTQASTYASTMVRTIVHTQRTTVTDYHTVTNAVHGQAGVYY